jgi:hypothetical protein
MGCLVFLLSMISARLALAVVWIFTVFVDRAFDSFIVPLLGLIFLPWTTLLYVLVWTPRDGVSPLGWALVVIAFLADLGSLFGGNGERRARYAA